MRPVRKFVRLFFVRSSHFTSKIIDSKQKVGAKPPCCPQGLGCYRAIARSQPSNSYFAICLLPVQSQDAPWAHDPQDCSSSGISCYSSRTRSFCSPPPSSLFVLHFNIDHERRLTLEVCPLVGWVFEALCCVAVSGRWLQWWRWLSGLP